MLEVDVAVIGGGAAGLAAAIKAAENSKVILLDRNDELGGVLPQCIHDGFGNFIFKKMLTGPEYTQFFIDKIEDLPVDVKLETTVIGLPRNIVQCLEDYNIPLHLSHTVVNIHGLKRVEGVTVAKVDGNLQPIKGTEQFIPCDTLILAVGLIPENELSKEIGIPIDTVTGGPFVDNYMETMIPGFFACGNVVQVYDLVDDVTLTGEIAGRYASFYAKGILNQTRRIPVFRGRGIDRVVPQFIREDSKDVTLYLRVKNIIRDAKIYVRDPNDNIIYENKRRIVKPAVMEKIRFTLKGFYGNLTVGVER